MIASVLVDPIAADRQKARPSFDKPNLPVKRRLDII
jgi:hypothetical protein